MTAFEVTHVKFSHDAVQSWARANPSHTDWPVVYVLDSAAGSALPTRLDVYVGETLNAQARLRQHLDSGAKRSMRSAHVVVDERFNKSAALDLESFLIRLFAGDGRFSVLNRNEGVVDSNYFDRAAYRSSFVEVFERLKEDGLFTRGIAEIENDDLFKLSPFKALTAEQLEAVESIMRVVADRLIAQEDCTIVVRGAPGTGKTIVGIYLMKLIADLGEADPAVDVDSDSSLSALFNAEGRERYQGLDVGLVVPQQSLRGSVQRVFRNTPGLAASQVYSPFTAAKSPLHFDVLIIDETHRLNLRASQPSGPLNKDFGDINRALFGSDDRSLTQLDWMKAKSRIRILLLDERQAVMPADLTWSTIQSLIDQSKTAGTYFSLKTQMRVRGGTDYVERVRSLFDVDRSASSLEQAAPGQVKDGYDLRFFDDVRELHDAIREQDRVHGLSRLIAGYAWDWRSRHDASAIDIPIGGYDLQWNKVAVDWINSPEAIEQVGSIHTVQGYDLNYAGVIIGPDLRLDPVTGRLAADRESYFDKRGKQNNNLLGRTYSDSDLTRFIADIYGVLLTRGIRGTYLHVVDPALRRYLEQHL